ncbi:U box domain containing protein [Klebsormidium nitens]|uniref:RING-type E3 ubiquitin transferase n=1 Tax=Klebsormidium nitens TaxID=105231 RepID=A0A1Y1IBV4_KLENI|nr:U box domain containing protein [Klebsormidium nitens]|eukprot:GAQ88053.1 U box domain containing protein [Klebsormidium nitens]
MASAEVLLAACRDSLGAIRDLRGGLAFHKGKAEELVSRLEFLSQFLEESKPTAQKQLKGLLELFVQVYKTLQKCSTRKNLVAKVISYARLGDEILDSNGRICLCLGDGELIESIPREHRMPLKNLRRRLQDTSPLCVDERATDAIPEGAVLLDLEETEEGCGVDVWGRIGHEESTRVKEAADFLLGLGVGRVFPHGIAPPERLCCPLTGALLLDPLVLETGIPYHRKGIEFWLQRNMSCPATKLPVSNNVGLPEPGVRAGAIAWVRGVGLPRLMKEVLPPQKDCDRKALEKLLGELSNEDLAELANALASLIQLFGHMMENGEVDHRLLNVPGCTESLVKLLGSSHALLQEMAAELMCYGQVESRLTGDQSDEAARHLGALLNSEREQTQICALDALDSGEQCITIFELGPDVLVKIVQLAQSESHEVQSKAVGLLGSLLMYAANGAQKDAISKVPNLFWALMGIFLHHPSADTHMEAFRALCSLPLPIGVNLADVPGFIERLVRLEFRRVDMYLYDASTWWDEFVETPESLPRLAGFLAGSGKEHQAAREIGMLLGLQDVPGLDALLTSEALKEMRVREPAAKVLLQLVSESEAIPPVNT